MDSAGMVLRSAMPQDAAAIHHLFCVPKVYEYLADGEAPPPHIVSEWVQAGTAVHRHAGAGLWMLVEASEAQIVGVVRLSGDGSGTLELVFLLHPRVWGRGLATRMAHTVMGQAFGTGQVSTIWAGADAPNTASIAVMQRLGMRYQRAVAYPMGAGVEYALSADAFDAGRIQPLPMR